MSDEEITIYPHQNNGYRVYSVSTGSETSHTTVGIVSYPSDSVMPPPPPVEQLKAPRSILDEIQIDTINRTKNN